MNLFQKQSCKVFVPKFFHYVYVVFIKFFYQVVFFNNNFTIIN